MEDIDPRLMARIEKEGVGPFLRHLREEKEVSLRSVSEHTRIRTYYLESIERGDFDKLPTGPVGLGFVRAFADAIGVDSKAVAASYKREKTGGIPLEEDGLESETRILFSSPPRANRFSSVATFVFVLVFVLAGGSILWFMKGRTEQLVPVGPLVDRIKTAVAPVAEKLPGVDGKAKGKNGVGRETASLEKKTPEQERSAVATVNLREPPVSEKKEEPSPAVEKVTPRELPLTLRIFAAEDTWLRIVVDAKKTEELLLLAGNEKDWKASEKFTLTVGNVAGTQVSLNGTEVALPRNSSNVLRDFVIPRKSLN